MKLNDRVRFAQVFASALHDDRNQIYEGKPYSFHLEQVVDNIIGYDVIDKDILAAGWLHDCVEDTGVGLATIRNLFGERIASLVDAVTDAKGPDRKTRKALTYPKILAVPGATVIKLADRMANIRFAIATGNKRQIKMYQKEFPEFHDKLNIKGDNQDMWLELAILHRP